MFGSLFKKRQPRNNEWVKQLVWLPVGHPSNPFPKEALDCRPVALKFWSATQNPGVAETFGALRNSDGRDLIGKMPESAVPFDCDLQFPAEGEKCEGPLFKARQMEDKWDFFHFDSRLYMRRSWTGRLLHVAECSFDKGTVRISRFYSEPKNVFEDRNYAIARIHFLVTSYLLGKPVPFPIYPEMPRAATEAIALTGFNDYGRRAQFAAFCEQDSVGG